MKSDPAKECVTTHPSVVRSLMKNRISTGWTSISCESERGEKGSACDLQSRAKEAWKSKGGKTDLDSLVVLVSPLVGLLVVSEPSLEHRAVQLCFTHRTRDQGQSVDQMRVLLCTRLIWTGEGKLTLDLLSVVGHGRLTGDRDPGSTLGTVRDVDVLREDSSKEMEGVS
jgi:hypothetical protein